jgi:hypothetical protein
MPQFYRCQPLPEVKVPMRPSWRDALVSIDVAELFILGIHIQRQARNRR